MRAFRIGYILTFSFLLVLMVVSLTFGYYTAPKGPKAPTYPTSSAYPSSSSSNYTQQLDQYDRERAQYDKDQKTYQDKQKTFVQDKIVPYARNVFVSWIVILLTFQVLGLVLAHSSSPLVGAGFAFSGFWAVLFGPLGGLLWFVNSLVSSFGRAAEQDFSVEPILQAIGITCLLGVVVLAVLGMFFYGKVKVMLAPLPQPTTP